VHPTRVIENQVQSYHRATWILNYCTYWAQSMIHPPNYKGKTCLDQGKRKMDRTRSMNHDTKTDRKHLQASYYKIVLKLLN